VEWDFLATTLTFMGFPNSLIWTIMKCVTIVTFSILINGQPSSEFQPQRDLRQGDPLSSYLFISYANVLSGLLSKAQHAHHIHGVKIALRAPEVSHLLSTDDSLMFYRATTCEVTIIASIIQQYQQTSSQLVNFSKFEMVFSKGISETSKAAITQILQMSVKDHFS
jgi:hypothetical protein